MYYIYIIYVLYILYMYYIYIIYVLYIYIYVYIYIYIYLEGHNPARDAFCKNSEAINRCSIQNSHFHPNKNVST